MVDTDKGPAPQDGQSVAAPSAQPEPKAETPTNENDWSEEQTAFESTDAEGDGEEPTATGDGQPKEAQPSDAKVEEKGEDPKDETKAEDGADEDEGNWWSADDLNLPPGTSEDIYRSVSKHLRRVQGKVMKKYQAAVDHGRAFQGAWQNQMAAFAQVAKAPPEKRLEIVNALLQENAPILKKYGVEAWQEKASEPEIPPEIEQLTIAIAEAESPQKAVELMKKRDLLFMKHVNSQNAALLKQVREEGVRAAEGVVAPIKDEAKHAQKVSGWSGAIETLKAGGKNTKPIADLEKYMPKIAQFIYGDEERGIQADPEAKTAILLLNEDPERAQKLGLSRIAVLRRAYLQISNEDRVKAAKEEGAAELKKQLSESGEMPGRYVQTKSTEGQDWDELEKEYRAGT